MNQQSFSIQEAATFLGISLTALSSLEEKKLLQPFRTADNQKRYTKEQLQSFKDNPLAVPASSSRELPSTPGTSVHAGKTAAQVSQTPSPVAAPLASQLHNETNVQVSSQQPQWSAEDTSQTSNERRKRRRNFLVALLVLLFAGLIFLLGFVFVNNMPGLGDRITDRLPEQDKTPPGKETPANVPGSEEAAPAHMFTVNIPSVFGKQATFLDSVSIKKGLTVDGLALLRGGVMTENADVDAGTGRLTASNVIYSLVAGSNISISGDPQNPTISANIGDGSVTSVQGQTGAVSLAAGSGIGLDGLTIINTGVLTVQGQSGAISFSPGAGITIDGLTITNSDPGSAQRIFSTFSIEGTDITAESNSDTFTFAAGSGVTLTANTTDKSLTISAIGGGGGSQWTTTGSDIYYNTGNVGIGNTAPARTLDVTGTGRFSGAFTLSSLGAGIVKSDGSGLLSSSAINLASADVTGTLAPANGGTGVSATPTNGQILIGNGSGFTLGTITAGSGIGVANGSGTITITNNGVTSLTGTANQVTTSGSTGDITLSLPQDIATTSSPTFASMTLTANTNQLTLGTGNTGVLSLATLTSGQTYTLPDASGEICLSIGNCPSGGGGNINGSGTTNYIPKFTGMATIGNSIMYDTGNKIGVGTTSPEGLFSVVGGAAGQPLVSLNETGDQNILVGSASGTTRFVFDRAGNLDIIGGEYRINGTSVLSSTTLGSGVINSSLTSVGALNAGSITSGFGSIDIGPDTLTAGGTITFGSLGAGIVKSDSSGVLSSGPLNLASAEVTGTLGVGNGGTGTAATPTNGQLLIGNGTGYTLAGLTGGTAIQVVNGAGSITLNNTGVTSLAGTVNQVNVSSPTGDVTLSLPQDIHAGATPSFASLNLTNNTNPLILGTTNTATITLATLTGPQTYTLPNASGDFCLTSGNCAGVGGTGDITTVGDVLSGDAFSAAGTQGRSLYFYDAQGRGQLTTADLTQVRTYTLPDADGTVCLTSGNCAGVGGSITGAGTAGQVAFFNGAGTITSETAGFAWDATNNKLGIGNDTPQGKLDVTGGAVGKALTILNETGDQNILTASASGTTVLNLERNGNLAIEGALSDLTGTVLTINDDVQVNGNDLLDSGAATRITLGATTTLTNTALTLAGTTTLTGTSLTSIIGGATAIDFTEFDVNAGTGSITIDDDGNLGNIAVEGTILDIDSLTFVGAGAIQTTGSTTLTLGGSTTGDITFNPGNAAALYLASNGNVSLSAPVYANCGSLSTVANVITCGSAPVASTQYVRLIDGAFSFVNDTADYLFGSVASSSAKFKLSPSGTSPTASVSGSTSYAALTVDNTGNGDLFTASKSGATKFTVLNDGNVRINNLVSCGTINSDASGLLGCGAVASATTLQGAYDADVDGSDAIISLLAADDSLIFRNPAVGGTDSTFLLNLDQLSTAAKDALVINSAGADANFGFRVNDDGLSSDATPFVITNTGNVGVGTTDPTAKLDVAGTASVAGALTFRAGAGEVQTTANNTLTLGGSTTGDVVIDGNTFLGSPTTGLNVTTAGAISDVDGIVNVNDDLTVSGVVTVGNTTNGLQFNPASGPTYFGTARPARTISLQPEYAGAVLTSFYGPATDTNITGLMTSDAEILGSNNLRTFYEWERTADATQHFYTVAVRVRLPKDFGAWSTNGIQVDYKTESATNTVSDLDVRVYLESDTTMATTDAESLNNASTTWTTINITGASLDEVNAADETAVIYLRMGSASSNHVRTGEIRLNYVSTF